MSLSLNDRQQIITDLLRDEGPQDIAALSKRFGVATQTVRRDINELCEHGMARRVHGGVAPARAADNQPFSDRLTQNAAAQRAIGRAAAGLIPSGASVFLGVGTTVQLTAQCLLDTPDLTVVTNNLDVALHLCAATSHSVHVAGGELRPEDRDMIGPSVLAAYDRIRADVAIIGAGALDAQHGVLDHKSFDAELGAVMIRNARTRILVADHSKWSRRASHFVAPFSAFTHVVTDAAPENPASKAFRTGTLVLAQPTAAQAS